MYPAFIFASSTTFPILSPTKDIWIAASAMRHCLPLVTVDRHFEASRGLLVIAKAEGEAHQQDGCT